MSGVAEAIRRARSESQVELGSPVGYLWAGPGTGRPHRRCGVMELPKCQKCNNGTLIPLSDYGQEGASVIFKAWVCTNPECGFSLRVDKGEVTYGKRIETKH